MCDEILPFVKNMKFHEKENLGIIRYKGKTVKTDHKMLCLELNINIHNETKHNKTSVFNMRNKN